MEKTTPPPLAELAPNPRNPRSISDEAMERLKKSLAEFGDLGGIILNQRTGRLVGGHRRVEAFRSDPEAETKVGRKLEAPDRVGTIAHGYVVAHGTRYAYRLVDWDEQREAAANLAANQHGGEFDLVGVAEILRELDGHFPLELTGFSEEEIAGFVAMEPHFDAGRLPDTPGAAEIAPQAYIVYLTFRSPENHLEALRLLTGGARYRLPEGAKYCHVDGDGPANAEGTETVLECLRRSLPEPVIREEEGS